MRAIKLDFDCRRTAASGRTGVLTNTADMMLDQELRGP